MVAAAQIIGLQMDVQEARQRVAEIQHHLNRVEHHSSAARSLIWELHNREGWKALGYPSWRACVMVEFEQASSSVYRQLNAALVELELSPNGGIGEINERVLRPLTKRGLDEDSRHFVWQVCEAIVGQGGKITSGITEAVVEGLEDILRTGAFQDSEGEQRLYGVQMSADLTARALEQKQVAQQKRIQRMDKPRDYIVGGRKIDSSARATINGRSKASVIFELQDSAEVEKLSEALRLGKPIYCSLWTED